MNEREKNIIENDVQPNSNVKNTKKEIYEWIQAIVSSLVVVIIVFSMVVRIIGVSGPSMKPTLNNQDKVVLWCAFYTPQRGDVVVLDPRASSGYTDLFVKRIIAVGGDTIYIDPSLNQVFVNGKLIDEPYILEEDYLIVDVSYPLTIPEGYVFVMGDNRNESYDSRNSRVGLIDEREILGKVIFRIFPLNSIGAIK